jgi:hypothetical protein
VIQNRELREIRENHTISFYLAERVVDFSNAVTDMAKATTSKMI